MTDDYIKREDAINTIRNTFTGMTADTLELRINDIPSVDVAPVRYGHWIINGVRKYELSDGETAYVPEYECSWCGFTTESYVRLDEPIMPEDADFPKYCEYCGAKMDGGDTDA